MTTEDLTAEVLELKKGLTDLQRRVFPPPVVLPALAHERH
jgi:hypothetical protein